MDADDPRIGALALALAKGFNDARGVDAYRFAAARQLEHLLAAGHDVVAATAPAGLTAQQRRCALVIQTSVDRLGYPPTYEEIRAAMGLGSKSGVMRLVSGLAARGWLEVQPKRARSMRLRHRLDEIRAS